MRSALYPECDHALFLQCDHISIATQNQMRSRLLGLGVYAIGFGVKCDRVSICLLLESDRTILEA
jgi:hypothetical protein